MVFTDRIRGRHGIVRELIVLGNGAHQLGRGLPVRQLLAQEGVEHGAGGVERLQFVLNVERGEDILGVADGQVRAVGVVGRTVHICRDNVGIALDVVLGQAIGGGLGGRGLEVIEVAVLLLIVGQAVAHMVEHFLGELLRGGIGHIGAQPLGVQTDLVHADQADGREVVVERAQVALGIGVQALVEQLGDDGTLDLERARGNIHHVVEPAVEVGLILCQIGDAGHIDGDHTDRAGALSAAEEAAGFLAKLAQVQTQTAAHAAHVAGRHIAVDIVGEIGRAVLGGHLEQQAIVLGIGPVEVAGDRVSGNGILEAAAVGVALEHGLDEGLIDHIHFLLAVAVGEVHLLAADDCGKVGQIVGHRPVERDVGERRLCAPAAGRIDAEDERFDALLDLAIGEVIDLDKGR